MKFFPVVWFLCSKYFINLLEDVYDVAVVNCYEEYLQSNFRTTQTLMLCLVTCDVQSVTPDCSFSGNHKLIN